MLNGKTSCHQSCESALITVVKTESFTDRTFNLNKETKTDSLF